MASRAQQVLAHLTTIMSTPNAPEYALGDQKAQVWSGVPLAPPDSIFKLTASYKSDTFPQKVNLGVGAYRDDNSKPWVLPVVKRATEILLNDATLDHEYLPITGLPEYTTAAGKLILGLESAALREGRVSSVQTISGTGANHLGALFLSRFYQWNGPPTVYLSNPTWANHFAIFKNVGIEPKEYPYFKPKTIGLDFEGFTNSLRNAAPRSVFLLHACAHNPTGVDPTMDQWQELAALFLEKGHYAFFDCAYQGFASGDLDKDASAVRLFEQRGVPMLVCQSFAKNAGLYGERVGCLHVVGVSKDETDRVKSQLSVLQRSEISNPPAHGARLISLILNDPVLFDEWKVDIKIMAHRIIDMRYQLHAKLTNELKTPGNWDHIINQIGMFSFTGINTSQATAMNEKAHIYMTANGRISMAGLNSKNLSYVAESLDKAVRGTL
ncbi:Aspartate aminotransferase, cytoplasmic [Tulasnella sp. JGI-2019a]|nr:Aspartate aminotransferase, cytoplasmic [Tulasnella sp. JGI-2019a]